MAQPAPQRIIGLMSGTSVDGIDAALVEIHEPEDTWRMSVLAHETYPYPDALRQQLLDASYPDTSRVDLICHANMAVGHCFADAALAVADLAGLPIEQVDLIGSHGQTLYHIPQATAEHLASTLQIGEPCVIAERTGVTTVADFRPRDMAAGGIGAPLAPYGHHLLFAHPQRTRAVQNIGGIGNVSVLANADPLHTLAFDTGPGNMVMDEAVRHYTHGEQHYDAGGELAAQGTVHPDLLEALMAHPFVAQAPPKATGREAFGRHFWRDVLTRAETLNLSANDVVRTCAAFTAESIGLNYERFIAPHTAIDDVIICGGGAENPVLLEMLRQRLHPTPVYTPDAFGYPNQALEAILFALLAHATVRGRPANAPRTTGATHPVILGKIIPGHPF